MDNWNPMRDIFNVLLYKIINESTTDEQEEIRFDYLVFFVRFYGSNFKRFVDTKNITIFNNYFKMYNTLFINLESNIPYGTIICDNIVDYIYTENIIINTYFTNNNIDLINANVNILVKSTNCNCNCLLNDDKKCIITKCSSFKLTPSGDEYNKKILTIDEIEKILFAEPSFIFVLFDIFNYNKTYEILNTISNNSGYPIFNPTLFNSLDQCIVCMKQLSNQCRRYICNNKYCHKYLEDYFEMKSYHQFNLIISRNCPNNVNMHIMSYIDPLYCIKDNHILNANIKTSINEFWYYMFDIWFN